MITKVKKSKSSSRNLVRSIKGNVRLNKSEEIRRLAKKMRKDGVEPKGNDIVEALAKRKIKVTSYHVCYALNRHRISKSDKIRATAEQMCKDNVELRPSSIVKLLSKKGVKVSIPHVIQALKTYKEKLYTAKDLIDAKNFVEKVGNFQKAINILNIYKTFHKIN